MSERCELARSIYARWERGDFTDSSWAHPDIECVNGFESSSTHGIRAMAAVWRGWLDAWENFAVSAEEYVETDRGVLVLSRFHGMGKTSGLSVDALLGACWFEIRDGKVTLIRLYTDRAQALREFGS